MRSLMQWESTDWLLAIKCIISAEWNTLIYIAYIWYTKFNFMGIIKFWKCKCQNLDAMSKPWSKMLSFLTLHWTKLQFWTNSKRFPFNQRFKWIIYKMLYSRLPLYTIHTHIHRNQKWKRVSNWRQVHTLPKYV